MSHKPQYFLVQSAGAAEYDTKPSDGEAPVMLWGMRSTPL